MFYSFTTIPADNNSSGNSINRHLLAGQKIFTWFLVSVWFSLISFGLISLLNPQWLQEWSRLGIESGYMTYKNFGDSYLYQGDYYKAVAQYQRALEIKPDQAGVMINLSIAYMYTNSYKNAAKMLRDASKLENNLNDLINFNIGELMERQGKKELALKYFLKAQGSLFLDPVLINRKLGKLYLAEMQYEKAITEFEKSLANQLDIYLPYKDMLWRCLDTYSDDTINIPIIENLLSKELSLEDFEPYDLKIINQQHQTDPEIAKTHNHLAYIQVQIKNYASARNHYLKSLQIWPNNIDGQKGIAFLSQNQQNTQQAGR